MGGISQRASWVLENRKKIDLLIDGGRAFFRPGSSLDNGAIKRAKKLFKYYVQTIHYDACSISADELLVGGVDFFKNLNKTSKLFISLNILEDNRPIFLPYKIKEVKGLRLAIIGLTENSLKKIKNVEISDPYLSLKRYWDQIRKESDLIICATNLNRLKLKVLIKKFPQIAVVVSSGIGVPTYVPIKIGKSIIVSTHPKGKSIGLLKLHLNKNGSIKTYSNKLIMLRETTLIGESF